MKFKVGQPVWSIGHCSGKFRAAVIVKLAYLTTATCRVCKAVSAVEPRYEIVMESGWITETAVPWTSHESALRPRDLNQFEPAEDDFELPIGLAVDGETNDKG